jgi:hypothetical protein
LTSYRAVRDYGWSSLLEDKSCLVLSDPFGHSSRPPAFIDDGSGEIAITTSPRPDNTDDGLYAPAPEDLPWMDSVFTDGGKFHEGVNDWLAENRRLIIVLLTANSYGLTGTSDVVRSKLVAPDHEIRPYERGDGPREGTQLFATWDSSLKDIAADWVFARATADPTPFTPAAAPANAPKTTGRVLVLDPKRSRNDLAVAVVKPLTTSGRTVAARRFAADLHEALNRFRTGEFNPTTTASQFGVATASATSRTDDVGDPRPAFLRGLELPKPDAWEDVTIRLVGRDELTVMARNKTEGEKWSRKLDWRDFHLHDRRCSKSDKNKQARPNRAGQQLGELLIKKRLETADERVKGGQVRNRARRALAATLQDLFGLSDSPIVEPDAARPLGPRRVWKARFKPSYSPEGLAEPSDDA